MTDIPMILSPDGTSLDWCNPLVLAQPIDNSLDLTTYIMMLLSTDRVVPMPHGNLLPWQRHGSWHDAIVGEFGSLFWLGLNNEWSPGIAKLSQIAAWAQQALQTIFDEGLIQAPATIDAEWISAEAVQVTVGVRAASGAQRTVTYVLG